MEIRNSKGERVFLYDRHMPETDDLAYLVLKGHLVVEEVLDRLSHSVFPHPEHIEKLEPGFRTLALVVRAAVVDKSEDAHWDLIRMLNELRNKFAHNLVPQKVEEKLRELFTIDRKLHQTDDSDSVTDPESLRRVVQHCIEFLGSLE